VTVLDGAVIGSECVVGAGAVIRGKIPNSCVVAVQEKLIVVPRGTFSGQTSDAAQPSSPTRSESRPAQTIHTNGEGPFGQPRIVALVLRAVASVNEMLPEGSRMLEHVSSSLAQPHGPLDSLGVMNLLVAVEDEVEREFGRRPNLTEIGNAPGDLLALSNVRSLAKFVAERLKK